MRWRTSVVAGAACLLIAACGEDGNGSDVAAEDGSAARASEATGSATPSRPATEDAYLRALRDGGQVDDVSDEALLAAGRETCGALDRGVPPLEIAMTGVEASGRSALAILGAAASTLCREHLEAVREMANETGL